MSTSKQLGTAEDLLQQARLALYDGAAFPVELRPTVSRSWTRSRLASLQPDKIDVPYRPSAGVGERLLRAASPVLDRFAERLDGSQVSIVLADPEARVVGRWAGDPSSLHRMSAVSIDVGFVLSEEFAGTNGIGTVLEDYAPVTIHGGEHYAEPLRDFLCVGVPVRNPISRRVEGVLDLACPSVMASGLLLPTALSLAAQIESELATGMSRREMAVFEEFLARSRETSAPLIALGEQFLLTNAAAANLLEPSDQALFWDQAVEAFGSGMSVTRRFVLGSGDEVQARCKPIRIGSLAVGALIEVAPGGSRSPATRAVAELTPRCRPRSQARTDLDRLLADPAVSSATRLRIEGESGSGKWRIAERLGFEGGYGEPVTILRCATVPLDGSDVWLTAFAARLTDPSGTLILRNLELLPEDLVRAVVDLLDHTPNPPRTVTTVTLRVDRASLPGPERFGGIVVRVPPLRDCREDIPGLVEEMLSQAAAPSRRVVPRAMTALVGFGWPGNLRQLASALSIASVSAGSEPIELNHLPEEIRNGSRGRRLTRLQELERDAIANALRESHGNKIRTAEMLGLSRSTLYRRLRHFGLDDDRTVL